MGSRNGKHREAPVARATFWAQPTVSTKFWRCEVPARYLDAKVLDIEQEPGQFDLVEADSGPRFRVEDQEGTYQFKLNGQEGDVAVWQFPARPPRMMAIEMQRQKGVRVLFECDDNYLQVPPHLPGPWERTDIIYEVPHHPEDVRSSIKVARQAAMVSNAAIVSTRYLERLYRRELSPHVFFCPNCVDPQDWPEEGDHHRDGVIRIGTIGSMSHYHDLPLLSEALRWASDQPGVEVLVVGGYRPEWTFPYRHIPYIPDHDDYRHVFTKFDIVLAPVFPTDWSLARSDNKVMEAAMGGATTIVSGCEVFRDWVRTGTAIPADTNTPTGFRRALQRALRNMDDTRAVGRAARERTLKERTIQDNAWRWEEAFERPSRTRYRRPTFAYVTHGGLAEPYSRALVENRWRAVNPQHTALFMCDYPVRFWGPRWDMCDATMFNGGACMGVPHGMIPMLQYDGCAEIHPHVKHEIVPSQGWADLYAKMGHSAVGLPVGWSTCEILPWKPAKNPKRVLLATAHPNTGNGDILPHLQTVNELGHRMLAASKLKRAVRFWGEDAPNGIHKRVNGVKYNQLEALGIDYSEIDQADLVIAYGSFLTLALARGVPAVALADPQPIMDDGTFVANHLDDWWPDWEYPVKVGDATSIAGLIDLLREKDDEVQAWRERYVGSVQFRRKPFSDLMFEIVMCQERVAA